MSIKFEILSLINDSIRDDFCSASTTFVQLIKKMIDFSTNRKILHPLTDIY